MFYLDIMSSNLESKPSHLEILHVVTLKLSPGYITLSSRCLMHIPYHHHLMLDRGKWMKETVASNSFIIHLFKAMIDSKKMLSKFHGNQQVH